MITSALDIVIVAKKVGRNFILIAIASLISGPPQIFASPYSGSRQMDDTSLRPTTPAVAAGQPSSTATTPAGNPPATKDDSGPLSPATTAQDLQSTAVGPFPLGNPFQLPPGPMPAPSMDEPPWPGKPGPPLYFPPGYPMPIPTPEQTKPDPQPVRPTITTITHKINTEVVNGELFDLGVTTSARVRNLPDGAMVFYRFREVIQGKRTDWHAPMPMVLKEGDRKNGVWEITTGYDKGVYETQVLVVKTIGLTYPDPITAEDEFIPYKETVLAKKRGPDIVIKEPQKARSAEIKNHGVEVNRRGGTRDLKLTIGAFVTRTPSNAPIRVRAFIQSIDPAVAGKDKWVEVEMRGDTKTGRHFNFTADWTKTGNYRYIIVVEAASADKPVKDPVKDGALAKAYGDFNWTDPQKTKTAPQPPPSALDFLPRFKIVTP